MPRLVSWAAGVILPAAATGVGALGREIFGLPSNVVLVILAIVLVALIGGLGPAILAAIVGASLLNYFFTHPLYTFTIADRADIITLIVGVMVAMIVAVLVAALVRRSQQATRAALEAELLAEAEANALRTALLSALGHDLRTPLTSIKAAIGSLRDPYLRLSADDTTELHATIEESADRLTGLIDNLLDSSRLATGTVAPLLAPTNYDELVTRVLAVTPAAAPITVDIDEYLPDVIADAGLLERVIANVVDNAVRHAPGAPVTITAATRPGRVELRVADRGPGIAPGERDSLFAPFQRAGDRNTTTGVGLGLSVARGFTAAMGGTITADDTPGGGLTIAIALPVAGAGTAVTAA